MIEPLQLALKLIITRGATFYLPLRIEDTDGNPLDFTGKVVQFQVKDKTQANAPCCNDLMAIDIKSSDANSPLVTTAFTMVGGSPVIQGNFRLTLPPAPPSNDASNTAGRVLTTNLSCQDSEFRILQITPSGTPAVADLVEVLVYGRIRID